MSNYASLNELFITVDNATHVINNVAHDDDTVTVATGIDWFTFQNVVVSNIYVSGNSWVGIGTNAEASSIKVNRRDTKLYDLWTEIGTIGDSIQYKFYRWRWSGYAQYNSTSTGDKLIWDCVLFEDGTVYLNIDTWPSNDNNGTNGVLAATTCSFTPSATSRQFTFKRTETAGLNWSVQSGLIEPLYHKILFLYSDVQGLVYFYSSDSNTFTKIDGVTKEELTANHFLTSGCYPGAPWASMKDHLTHPVVLKWSDSPEPQNVRAEISGTPVAQAITSFADLSSATIKGIKSITSVYQGNVKVSYSYNNTEWIDPINMSDFIQIDLSALYNNLTSNKKIYFKVMLMDDTSLFTNLIVDYLN